MNGADWLIRALVDGGVEIVFGYPGGAIMPIYDAILGTSLKHILVRHEQGAALAADGYARATGKVGVCMATSGPGATNLVTGIANAFMDSVPLLCITGQVASPSLGTDAFQEVDILGITLPIVKHSFLVRDVRDVPAMVAQALRLAQSGRPGPVLLDVPKDVAQALMDAEGMRTGGRRLATRMEALLDGGTREAELEAVHAARALLQGAKRPLVYVGGGVGLAGAVHGFRRFIEVSGLPTVCTLKGLGALPTGHPALLGMLGMHGSRPANLAVDVCDVLLVVGARFDDRATGNLKHFATNAKVIHCDVDAAEMHKRRTADVSLVGDLNATLAALTEPCAVDEWRVTCAESLARDASNIHHTESDSPETGTTSGVPTDARINVPAFLRRLNAAVGNDVIFTTDVGQHQMWAAQHAVVHAPEQFLTSGGLGTMGYGLPAAMGAQLGKPSATVIALSGDGSIMMNVQELATLRRYGLPVKVIVFDNQTLGMVRQWQELFFNERFSETDLSDNPDFAGIARACGVAAGDVRDPRDVDRAIATMLAHKGPYLLHVHLDSRDNVWPLVPPGAGNTEMMGPKS